MSAADPAAAGTGPQPQVSVIGVDADGGAPVAPALAALAGAGLVVGAERHLRAWAPPGAERVVLGALEPALAAVLAHPGPVVVLASGDPGFFGIVRRLRQAGLEPRVHPAASSVAVAFARAGLPWDGAAVVSAHGREFGPALNACRALPLVAVLTAPGAGAAELGRGLVGWPRRLVVAELLGEAGERLTEVDPEQAAARTWADPHLVLSIATDARDEAVAGTRSQPARRDNQPAAAPEAGWALPEAAYRHRDSMITKAEVRAWAVARLQPRLGRLIWDVGAGSGSVGIECAALGAAVIAVESDPAAVDLIRENAGLHRVTLRVVAGAAPLALAGLPDPDAVFVGGGGAATLAAVTGRRPPRVVVALAAVDRLGAAVGTLREAGYRVEGTQLAASRLSELPHGSFRLAATNPITVLTGELNR